MAKVAGAAGAAASARCAVAKPDAARPARLPMLCRPSAHAACAEQLSLAQRLHHQATKPASERHAPRQCTSAKTHHKLLISSQPLVVADHNDIIVVLQPWLVIFIIVLLSTRASKAQLAVRAWGAKGRGPGARAAAQAAVAFPGAVRERTCLRRRRPSPLPAEPPGGPAAAAPLPLPPTFRRTLVPPAEAAGNKQVREAGGGGGGGRRRQH